jgi:hypothetical protein
MTSFHPAAAAIRMISPNNRGLKASVSATFAWKTSTIGLRKGLSRLVDMSSVRSVWGSGVTGCKSWDWRLGVRSAGGLWRMLMIGHSIRCWKTLECFGCEDCGTRYYDALVLGFMGSGSSSRVRVGETCQI